MRNRRRTARVKRQPGQPGQPGQQTRTTRTAVSNRADKRAIETATVPLVSAAPVAPVAVNMVNMVDVTDTTTTTATTMRPVTAADAPRPRPYRPTFAPPVIDRGDVAIVNHLLAGATSNQAYEAAGRPTGSKSPTAGTQRKKTITDRMRTALRRNQITGDYLVRECLKPALQANEVRFFKSWDGHQNVIDERTTENWDARLRALDMSFNLLGAYPARPSKLELDGEGTINIKVQRVD